MRTVLLAALFALLLGTAAHAAEPKPGAPLKVTPATACVMLRGSLMPTAMPAQPTSACCDGAGHCAQYISTEELLMRRQQGRT